MLDRFKKIALHNKFLIICFILFILVSSISYFSYTSKFIPIEKATVSDIEFYCNDIGQEIAEDIVKYVEENNIKKAKDLYNYKYNKTVIKNLGPKRFNELIRYFR